MTVAVSDQTVYGSTKLEPGVTAGCPLGVVDGRSFLHVNWNVSGWSLDCQADWSVAQDISVPVLFVPSRHPTTTVTLLPSMFGTAETMPTMSASSLTLLVMTVKFELDRAVCCSLEPDDR